MKTIKLLAFLLIGSVFIFIVFSAIWNTYNPPQYGFVDDSVEGQIHNVILDGRGEYRIRFWLSSQKPVIIETGTYSDPGSNEITLTPKNGRTYKIRVWDRDTKRPQYRIKK